MSELSLPRILFSLSPSLPLISLRYRRLCFLFVYLLPAAIRARVFSPRISFFLSTKLYPRQSRDAFPDSRSPLRDQIDVGRGGKTKKKKKKKKGREKCRKRNLVRAVFINPPLPFNRPLKDNRDRVVLIRDHCVF